MAPLRAQRTLVKSAPELWAEISELECLARHLGEFGEIRITRVEPETAVAWEGENARGTVELEPSGFGTRVTLTAEVQEPAVKAQAPIEAQPAVEAHPQRQPASPPVPEAVAPPVPEAVSEPAPGAAIEPRPRPAPAPEPVPPPVAPSPVDAAPDESLHTPLPPRRGLWSRLFTPHQPAVETASAPTPTPSPVRAPLSRPFGPTSEVRPIPDPPVPEPAAPDPEVPSQRPPAPGDAPEAEPTPLPQREPVEDEPDTAAMDRAGGEGDRTLEVLTAVLDTLGAAHHRPFSRE
jgi:hypothetical protein